MTTGNDLLDALIRLALAAGGVALGALLLVRGHRLTWLFCGVASFLLALFAVNLLNRWLGILDAEWLQAAIAVAAGILGGIAATPRPVLAYSLIGLTTAGSIYLWIARIILTKDALTALDFWTGLALIVALLLFMLLGAVFVIRYDVVALILLSSVIGVMLITEALALDHHSEWEAALALGMTLVGIVYQYHDYLGEQRAALQQAAAAPAPDPSS